MVTTGCLAHGLEGFLGLPYRGRDLSALTWRLIVCVLCGHDDRGPLCERILGAINFPGFSMS